MTIALFSDIYANLPALEAILEEIDRHKPDAIFCLGNLVGYNIWPNEVIEEIRRRSIPTVIGNFDYAIGHSKETCGKVYKTPEEKRTDRAAILFTNKVMIPEERAYLRILPIHIRIVYKLQTGMLNLMLVHATPNQNNKWLFEETEEQTILRLMRDSDVDVMCFGHTNKPYHRVLNDKIRGRFRHAINIGSVGLPKDGNPFACWTKLSLDESASLENRAAIKVEYIRVPYDVGKAASAIKNSPIPDVYADMLRNGY